MANIVITKQGTNGILVDFGDYTSAKLVSPQGFNAAHIVNVKPHGAGVLIIMDGSQGDDWHVNFEAVEGFMIIDTIAGVTVTSRVDLITKLTALM